MSPIGINNCLTALLHQVNEFVEFLGGDSIPGSIESILELVWCYLLWVILLEIIFDPIPYCLDQIQIWEVGRPEDNLDVMGLELIKGKLH